MNNWRLGLDLGTNSIGWSVLGLDDENAPDSLIDMGVRIFSDGRDPKTKEPLAVARRTARGIRRNLHRRKQRRRKMFKLLQEMKLYPESREEAQKLKAMNPYELRAKALDTILEPKELGRALFHLSVRRGFKSNRKESQNPENVETAEKETKETSKMTQADKCQSLVDTLKESDARTLGEFMWKQLQRGEGVRFVPGRSTYYPLRSLYEDEFFRIKEAQEKKHKNVDWEALHHAIFFQRPLKPQERGKCQFMPENPRTFKAMPSSNRFRILQDVLNLDMYDELNHKVPLSDEQADTIIQLLDTKDKATFDVIRKALKTAYRFNLETDNRQELKGNETSRKMRMDRHFGALWDTLPLEEQDDIVELLITADEDEQVFSLLNRYDLSDAQKEAIARLVLPSGTTSFCKEFTQKIVKVMQENRLQYHLATKALGYEHSDQKVDAYDLLPYYGKVLTGSTLGGDAGKYTEEQPEKKYGKIGNPTVHVALNQTRVVVNALIKQYGKPSQIVVELSRDLKSSRDAKREIMRKQAENAKRNAILNTNIKDLMKNIEYPGRFERQKFKLWEELGKDKASRCCLYCGKNISDSELFSPNIEIEHILPFSRTLLDAESNLTVAHQKCNAFKAERSPYEAFGTSPKGYDWEAIMARVNNLPGSTKKKRFAADAMEVFEKESGFITRQLTDNAYLSRISVRFLHAICDNVWTVNGSMTKLLRDKWEIDSILKKKINKEEIMAFGLKDDMVGTYRKNRYDHRHHALDSLVIGLTDRSMVKTVADLNARSHRNRLEAPAMPISRMDVIEKLKNIVVSFKPDHGAEGKLSKETLLGKIKQEELIPIGSLEENDIPNIKDERVRTDFMERCENEGSFKNAVKALRDVYPQIKVFREQFVSRTPITSIKAEKNIDDIIDPVIRKKLQDYIAINKGQKFESVLVQFSQDTGIKKVRCKTRIQTPIEIEPNPRNPLAVTRYLNPEDYFAAIVWEIPPAKEGGKPKFEAQYARRTEVDKAGKPVEVKPHPAAKKVCTIHKDDYIEFSEDGIWKKARIAGYAANDNRFDIRPIYATSIIFDWLIASNEGIIEKGWKPAIGQNYISVNILFGSLSARKITVSPIGKVFRKG